MHGWRGRLGLVTPSSNTTNEPEFYARLPDGVSLHVARMRGTDATPEQFNRMREDLDRCATLLSTADVDVVAFGCTTGSLYDGPDLADDIESQLADRAGVPAVATAASMRRAFDALGTTNLALVTPYTDEWNEREVAYLQGAGYEVESITGLGLSANADIGAESPESVYRRASAVDVSSADALFVSCTNYRTFEIIERLERDLGLPVLTSNQVTLWDALGHLGVDRRELDLGTLFTRRGVGSPGAPDG